MFARIIGRRKPQSGGLRVTRRGRRKYAVLPVRDITFFKEPPKSAGEGGAYEKRKL